VSCGVMTVGSSGDSSSKVSVVVKSDRVAMLMDGDCGADDPGFVAVSGVITGSRGAG